MAKPRKVIITCAVTGAIHTPSMSPHLPVTPAEIAEAAIGAAEAGAAIVHLHARDPENGKPVHTPEDFEPFLKVIKQSSNVVVTTTSGRCWPPGRTRCAWPQWPPAWAGMSAWGWKIRCGSARGTVRISVCGRAVEHYAAMALMKRSPKRTANCALAMDHSRGGIFHSFSDRFKIR